MDIHFRLAVLVAAVVCSMSPSVAIADAQSAAFAYYRNLERWDFDTGKEATAVARADTLVRGVYRLEDRTSGSFIALITERGDIRGDSTGWSRVGKGGIAPLTNEEMAQLRAEVMRNVSWERLIKVGYGDGGGRRLILVSAVDCPYCAKMEASLAQWSGALQTTFYVLPSALVPIDVGGDGAKAWATVAALWCSPDQASAWRRFWVTRSIPRVEGCALDAAVAQRTFRNFGSVMASIGAKVRGTPGFIREDGTAFGVPAEFGLDYARTAYGPEALQAFHSPLVDTTPIVWLSAPSHLRAQGEGR